MLYVIHICLSKNSINCYWLSPVHLWCHTSAKSIWSCLCLFVCLCACMCAWVYVCACLACSCKCVNSTVKMSESIIIGFVADVANDRRLTEIQNHWICLQTSYNVLKVVWSHFLQLVPIRLKYGTYRYIFLNIMVHCMIMNLKWRTHWGSVPYAKLMTSSKCEKPCGNFWFTSL